MCGRHESYLSTGRGLTLTQAVLESTVVAGLDWTLSYEFVSGSWQEEEEEGEGEIQTEYRSLQAGGGYNPMQEFAFSSPRNVFLYGRGGRENITLRLKMIGSTNQRIQVKFSNISVGGRSCKTVLDSSLGQYRCEMRQQAGVAGVFITEVEQEEESQQQCHCGVMHNTVITSTSNILLLTFRVTEMRPGQDWRDFLMAGSFRFVPTYCQSSQAGQGGGEVVLDPHSSDQALCDRTSWAGRARPGAQLYLRLPGTLVPHHEPHVCSSPARVVVRTAATMMVICPVGGTRGAAMDSKVTVMSGLTESSSEERLQSVSVELAGRWQQQFVFSWLEISPLTAQSGLAGSSLALLPLNLSCPLLCLSLTACISPSLRCDGTSHCPEGEDEAGCPHLMVPLYYLYAVLTAALVVFLITATILFCRSVMLSNLVIIPTVLSQAPFLWREKRAGSCKKNL